MSIFIKSEKQQWVVETKDLEEKDYSIKKLTYTGIMSIHVENNHEKWQFFFSSGEIKEETEYREKASEMSRSWESSFGKFHLFSLKKEKKKHKVKVVG